MAPLINAVPLILLTCLLALGRRVNLSLKTETVEGGKKDIVPGAKKISLHMDTLDLQAGRRTEDGKEDIVPGVAKISLHMDNLDLQAGGLDNAAGAQGAVATILMQEDQRVHFPICKEVGTHKVTQATGDAMAEFVRALKVVFSSIYADAKAAARAALYKSMDPGSGDALESKKKADAVAATLIDAEAMLFERTELLAGEAFGKEALCAYMLEGSERGKEKTVKRVLEGLHVQFKLLEIEIARVGFSPKDIVAVEKLQSGLSALEGKVEAMQGQEKTSEWALSSEGQVEAMQGQESRSHAPLGDVISLGDDEEIDLTKPLLSEASAIYWEMVQVLPDLLKVKLDLLRKIIDKYENVQGKAAVKGIKLPPKMKKRLALEKFLKAVDHMEQLMEMEDIIKNAIEEFMKAKVSSLAAYKVTIEKLAQAVKATMDKFETFDPVMKERQAAKIHEAVKAKSEQLQSCHTDAEKPYTKEIRDGLECDCQ